MSLSANAKLLLSTLREFGHGPTLTRAGQRWVATEQKYETLFPLSEQETRELTMAEFKAAWERLVASHAIEVQTEGAMVRLGEIGLKADEPAAKTSIQLTHAQLKKEKITVPQFDVKTAATSELIAKYNELNPDKPVKKFADRATAEKRVAAAMQALAKLAPAPAPAAKAPRSAPAPAAQKPDRSDERYVRNNVSVGGVVYKSVADAFKKIGLPMSRHIPFRAKVKTEGQATFEHEGKSYVFKKVEQAKLAE